MADKRANKKLDRSRHAELAQFLSWVEDGDVRGRDKLGEIFHRTGKAIKIAVTGPPGAGKSTLVDRLISCFREDGKTVAIVAVDPSSPITGGAFLGDRIRMQHHTKDSGVFVRSFATRSDTASVPASIAEITHVIDAYGFDVILIETIGTGQSDTRARDLADICIVVCAPGFGDFVQSAKAGILEIGDFLVVNKSDLAEAQDLFQDLSRRFHSDKERRNLPEVVAVSALTGSGVDGFYCHLVKKISTLSRGGELQTRRRAQFRAELLHHLQSRIAAAVADQSARSGSLDRAVDDLHKHKTDPLAAAENLWREYLRSSTGQQPKRGGREKG